MIQHIRHKEMHVDKELMNIFDILNLAMVLIYEKAYIRLNVILHSRRFIVTEIISPFSL